MQNADLETRLKSVLTNIQQAMSQRELTSSAFYDLVQNQLESHQIEYQGKDSKREDSYGPLKFSIDIIYGIQQKLNTKKKVGLKEDYQLLPTTTLSEEAQQDIRERLELEDSIELHLTEKYKKGEFEYEENLQKEIQGYIEEKVPQLNGFRSLMLASELTGRFSYRFNLQKRPNETKEYIEQIKEILDRI